MPKKKLSPKAKRSVVIQTKLLPQEAQLLRRISRRRRSQRLPDWSVSSVMREAFLRFAKEEA